MPFAWLFLLALAPVLLAQSASTGAIRFFGTGTAGRDRVRLQIDDNTAGNTGNRPADIGGVGFTVDFWIRGQLSLNTASARAQGSYNDVGWISGNIVVDRDIWGSGNHSERDWGISIAGGSVAFGTGNGTGPASQVSLLATGTAVDSLNTIHGDIPVLDNTWHHIAVVRDYVTGRKSIYVDGTLDYEVSSVSNDDISFPDAGVTVNPSGKDNPFIVLAAEKHDAGSAYPSFNGYMDEVRVWRRALGAGEIAFLRDKVVPGHHPGLAGYWRFEETTGTTINDSATVGPYVSGAPASTSGTLVNNTSGNGLRVYASADPANTAPVASLPLPDAPFSATRLAPEGTFTNPLFATHAPGQADRLYVVQQGTSGTGSIRIFDLVTNTVSATPFLSIPGLGTASEEGLLGLAFHPDYQANGALFVYLTNGTTGNNEVRRYFRATADTADPSSGQVILTLPHPTYTNHNGGWIGFGPDGMLYVATGDGGGGNDPSNNAQNIHSLLGKILRISPGTTPGSTYSIPAGNPFASAPGADEIWAYGLRNPWRCSFDRADGDLWIGDVGQSSFEEINRIPAGTSGQNFGWRPIEGFADNPGVSDLHPAGAVPPIADLGRTLAASITGGYVYRGNAISGLQGTYFFADYIRNANGNGFIFSFRFENGFARETADRTAALDPSPSGTTPGIRNISSFAEDARGELYLLDRGDGELFKIVPTGAWDLWRASQFTPDEIAEPAASGELGDPDGDRIPNLVEYASGTGPKSPGTAPLVAARETFSGQTHATLTFHRAAVSGITITGEGSADLGVTDPWSPANAVVVASSPTLIKIRSAAPLPPNGRYFLRFRITRP